MKTQTDSIIVAINCSGNPRKFFTFENSKRGLSDARRFATLQYGKLFYSEVCPFIDNYNKGKYARTYRNVIGYIRKNSQFAQTFDTERGAKAIVVNLYRTEKEY